MTSNRKPPLIIHAITALLTPRWIHENFQNIKHYLKVLADTKHDSTMHSEVYELDSATHGNEKHDEEYAIVQVPTARIRHSANQAIPTGFPLTVLDLDTVLWDAGAASAHYSRVEVSPGVYEGRLYCRETGVYLMQTNVRFAGHTTGSRSAQITLYDTAGVFVGGIAEVSVSAYATTAYLPILSPNAVWDWEEGEYIVIRVYQDSGGALNVLSSATISPELMITKVAEL